MTKQDRHAALRAGGDARRCGGRGLPDPAGWAFFLDLDGTLLDLAPRPDAVSAGPELAAMLAGLERMTSGALALVTGRRVDFVDGLFPGRHFTVAGLHGAELRPSPALADALADTIRLAHAMPDPDPAFRAARDRARAAAHRLPGVLFEDKGRAFALHYRQAPDRQTAVHRIMQAALPQAGPGYRLRPGKYVVELCPSGEDKGTVVHALMAAPPFLGRHPVAAGDDLTDEAMFRAVNALGGLSLRVGPADALPRSAAATGVATPADFRAWLEGLAA